MNWNDLPVFLAIAETGSLSAAARQLGNNHSTVFRRLNALEEDLGVRLFERFSGRYLLTSAGERMLELTRVTDGTVQQIERELAGRDFSPAGKVRLTTAPNISHTILPRAVKSLHKSHPQIVVEIAVGDTEYDLNRREADIALRATTQPPEHLVGRRVMTMDWWLCCARSNRRPAPKTLADLQQLPFIGADPSMLRIDAFQWLEANYSENILARTNDLSTMAMLAAAGLGYAVLPSDQDAPNLKRVFKVPNIRGELWLLTHPDLRNVARVKAVWEAVIAAIEVPGKEKG